MKKEKPLPIIKSLDGHIRIGKGFSRSELSHVGLDKRKARKLSIPVDERRKTAYVENIQRLREFLKGKSVR
jgi:ribosomal protein L13E